MILGSLKTRPQMTFETAPVKAPTSGPPRAPARMVPIESRYTGSARTFRTTCPTAMLRTIPLAIRTPAATHGLARPLGGATSGIRGRRPSPATTSLRTAMRSALPGWEAIVEVGPWHRSGRREDDPVEVGQVVDVRRWSAELDRAVG